MNLTLVVSLLRTLILLIATRSAFAQDRGLLFRLDEFWSCTDSASRLSLLSSSQCLKQAASATTIELAEAAKVVDANCYVSGIKDTKFLEDANPLRVGLSSSSSAVRLMSSNASKCLGSLVKFERLQRKRRIKTLELNLDGLHSFETADWRGDTLSSVAQLSEWLQAVNLQGLKLIERTPGYLNANRDNASSTTLTSALRYADALRSLRISMMAYSDPLARLSLSVAKRNRRSIRDLWVQLPAFNEDSRTVLLQMLDQLPNVEVLGLGTSDLYYSSLSEANNFSKKYFNAIAKLEKLRTIVIQGCMPGDGTHCAPKELSSDRPLSFKLGLLFCKASVSTFNITLENFSRAFIGDFRWCISTRAHNLSHNANGRKLASPMRLNFKVLYQKNFVVKMLLLLESFKNDTRNLDAIESLSVQLPPLSAELGRHLERYISPLIKEIVKSNRNTLQNLMVAINGKVYSYP